MRYFVVLLFDTSVAFVLDWHSMRRSANSWITGLPDSLQWCSHPILREIMSLEFYLHRIQIVSSKLLNWQWTFYIMFGDESCLHGWHDSWNIFAYYWGVFYTASAENALFIESNIAIHGPIMCHYNILRLTRTAAMCRHRAYADISQRLLPIYLGTHDSTRSQADSYAF